MDYFKDKLTKELEKQIAGREAQIKRNEKLMDIADGNSRWKFSNDNLTLTKDIIEFREKLENHLSRQRIELLTVTIILISAVNISFNIFI